VTLLLEPDAGPFVEDVTFHPTGHLIVETDDNHYQAMKGESKMLNASETIISN
jgi:hypothetical protein